MVKLVGCPRLEHSSCIALIIKELGSHLLWNGFQPVAILPHRVLLWRFSVSLRALCGEWFFSLLGSDLPPQKKSVSRISKPRDEPHQPGATDSSAHGEALPSSGFSGGVRGWRLDFS